MNGNLKNVLVVSLGGGRACSMDCPRYMTLRDAVRQIAGKGVFASDDPFVKIYRDLAPVPFAESGLLDVPPQGNMIIQELERRTDGNCELWAWSLSLKTNLVLA